MQQSIETLPLTLQLEALLLHDSSPLTLENLALKTNQSTTSVQAALQSLVDFYQDRSVNLIEADGMWHFECSKPAADYLREALGLRPPRLTPALMEILAIIASEQPITRAQIETKRGVTTSMQQVHTLIAYDWVVSGKRRQDLPGKPMTFVTTEAFLQHFRLASLDDWKNLAEDANLKEATEQKIHGDRKARLIGRLMAEHPHLDSEILDATELPPEDSNKS